MIKIRVGRVPKCLISREMTQQCSPKGGPRARSGPGMANIWPAMRLEQIKTCMCMLSVAIRSGNLFGPQPHLCYIIWPMGKNNWRPLL